MALLVFHVIVEEFWPTLLNNIASVSGGLQEFVYAQFSEGLTIAFESGWGLDTLILFFFCHFVVDLLLHPNYSLEIF